MSSPIKKLFLRTLKICGIVLASLLLIMILVPYLFPGAVTNKIKGWANNNINGSIAFSSTNLSFFKHFPSLTLTLNDVALKGSAPFENDTLIAAKEISLGIDLSSVFKGKVNISKLYLSNAFINIQVDTLGKPNYNIYKGSQQKQATSADTSSTSLGINEILVENSHLVYYDRSLPMKIVALGFNYKGSGDLSKDVFDLYTHTEIRSLDFYYNNQPYIISKKINGDLVTSINTRSLAFIFQKNDLNINQLPVQFNGRFAFLKDGYDMDFQIDSHEKDLDEIFTALPAEYQKLVDQTEVNGTGNIHIALTGKYIAKDSIMPDLSMNVKIRNGYIDNQKAPYPVSNLYLDLNAKLPGFDMDSLTVNVDSMYFNVGKGYFNSVIRVKGFNAPDIFARINSEIDLEQWNKAIGMKPINVKGKYSLFLLAEGRYAKSVQHVGLRKLDTVITSIPKFTLRSSFTDGYFKYASLPEAVKDISFELKADCPDNNYKHISMSVEHLNATALDNYIKGYFRLSNASDFPIDAKLLAKFHLADLKKFYPVDSLEMKGDLTADITAKGNYIPAKKRYPLTTANITLQNGSVQTKYYAHPIEQIQVNTSITNRTGTLKGTNISIKPISFVFEGEPFTLKAELHDPTNLSYNITSDGIINVGNIYQVFAQKGYNVKGTIAAHLSLKGKQSDVVAHRYDKLQNSGTLKVNNIALTSDLYPKPFVINKGLFSFKQDKMQFDAFTATYGSSVIVLNGALSNVIDYAMRPGAVLKGEFDLKSDLLVLDELTAFSGSQPANTTPAAAPATSSGVIIVPKTLDLTFTANVKKVKYSGLVIKDAKGNMAIRNDSIVLKETGFSIIGTPVTMDADYTSITPKEAFFDFHITAKDFDIKKAYKKIKMFHDMVTSAAHADGLISIDYQVSGKLNSNMMPVYPTIKGGGVLTAKALKMKGFKLFSAVGKAAERDSTIGGSPDVSKVDIRTKIEHNIITIERTRMRMAGFRARIQGQVSLSKLMDLKFRLGLPPLGIIGIPMNITGTEDNPKVRVGKSKKEDELPLPEEDD